MDELKFEEGDVGYFMFGEAGPYQQPFMSTNEDLEDVREDHPERSLSRSRSAKRVRFASGSQGRKSRSLSKKRKSSLKRKSMNGTPY